jgi:hypothetical protein
MKLTSFWTSEITDSMEEKVMACFNATFSQNKHHNYFKWKFRDNPFGESLHIIVEDEHKVISTRVFWRLDINGTEAYQCVDTSVLPEYQGKGLFKKTTLVALEILERKLIYNYPNELSGPAYIKSGWKAVENSTSVKFNLTSLMLKRAPTINWGEKELKWRFKENPEASYYAIKKDNYFYIFSLRRKNFFILLFKTKVNLNLKIINPIFIFSYDSEARGLAIRSKLPYMSKGAEDYNLSTYLFDMA